MYMLVDSIMVYFKHLFIYLHRIPKVDFSLMKLFYHFSFCLWLALQGGFSLLLNVSLFLLSCYYTSVPQSFHLPTFFLSSMISHSNSFLIRHSYDYFNTQQGLMQTFSTSPAHEQKWDPLLFAESEKLIPFSCDFAFISSLRWNKNDNFGFDSICTASLINSSVVF